MNEGPDVSTKAPPVAFVHVNVVPMDRPEVLYDHTVLIEGTRIRSVAQTVEIPSDTQVIDGQGGFLMPGLADMHVHLWMRDPDPAHLVLYLATGTTTVRSMSGPASNRGWREGTERGELLGPTILSADRIVIGGLDDWDPELVASMPVFVPGSPAEAAAEVRRQASGWADFAKVYEGLPEDQYLAAIAAANEVGLYVAGHLLDDHTVEDIVGSGLDEIAHLDELNFCHWIGAPDQPGFAFDYDAIPETAALLRHHDMAVVSNLVFDELMVDLIFDADEVLSRPEYATVRPELMDEWHTDGRHLTRFAGQGAYRRDLELPFFKELLRGLHEAGVEITLGTDTARFGEGTLPDHIHREIELLVEAGLPTFDALSAATATAGRVAGRMGRAGDFGMVVPGRRADLLLVRDNPLEDVSSTRERIGVMARGVWHPQEELDRAVAALVASYAGTG